MTTEAPACTQSAATTLENHELVQDLQFTEILYECRPFLGDDGQAVAGLHNVWISINNPRQYNSYTTSAVKEIILAFRRASCDRACVAVVFTAVGDKAFCTGGNTKEYAEYYTGRPQEYRQYMRLFNDMVTSILTCDKPVINRVNGMRIGGGQEIGMACDFTVSADTARYGQAGPKHGSAPDGGSTDFLHLYAGFAFAMESCVLCEPISAHKALRLGIINEIVPALRHKGELIANPMVNITNYADEFGRIIFGEEKVGDARNQAKTILAECESDHGPLDAAVEKMCTRLGYTMPDCTSKTLESVRKKKLEHWQRNCESNRAWLGNNMATEANAGFRAFNDGPKGEREVDFIELRRAIAEGQRFDEALIKRISPHYRPHAEGSRA